MSEPLGAGIKRIIWVATDKRYHRVRDFWWEGHGMSLRRWKNLWTNCYITKHEIWV